MVPVMKPLSYYVPHSVLMMFLLIPQVISLTILTCTKLSSYKLYHSTYVDTHTQKPRYTTCLHTQ